MDRRRRVRHNMFFGENLEGATRAAAVLHAWRRREPWVCEEVGIHDEPGTVFHLVVWIVQPTSPRAWEETTAYLGELVKRHGGVYLGSEDTWPWRRSGYWRAKRRRRRPA